MNERWRWVGGGAPDGGARWVRGEWRYFEGAAPPREGTPHEGGPGTMRARVRALRSAFPPATGLGALGVVALMAGFVLLGESRARATLPAPPSAAEVAAQNQEIDQRREARRRVDAGMALFAAGRYEKALVDLDAAVELDPSVEPYLWQRGICQYYVGRYDAGRRQFERHREVNGDDVENSVWHFLCTARQRGLPAARKAWLDIPRRRDGRHPDTRVPMAEVDALFRGEVKPEAVLAAAAAEEGLQQRVALFYAHLYLSLWHEIHGRPFQSLSHIRICVKDHGLPGAMGDVARFHLRRREGPGG